MHKLFSYVKHHIRTKQCAPILADENEKKFITPHQKALPLSHYFASVFNTAQSTCSIMTNILHSSIFISHIEFSEVLRFLKCTNNSLSITADGIPPSFFKQFADQLSTPLTHIFNISLMLGEVPQIWKNAIVTPIPKTSSASLLSEFRPIRILPTACKIMEKEWSCELEKKALAILNNTCPEEEPKAPNANTGFYTRQELIYQEQPVGLWLSRIDWIQMELNNDPKAVRYRGQNRHYCNLVRYDASRIGCAEAICNGKVKSTFCLTNKP
ncbi:hypothetical protein Y032_0030g2138 [Ancylostoma ceylanicum]|nr:hypothetical protein Y032_0030g2138 [Ancylostoma ceylanicum]